MLICVLWGMEERGITLHLTWSYQVSLRINTVLMANFFPSHAGIVKLIGLSLKYYCLLSIYCIQVSALKVL